MRISVWLSITTLLLISFIYLAVHHVQGDKTLTQYYFEYLSRPFWKTVVAQYSKDVPSGDQVFDQSYPDNTLKKIISYPLVDKAFCIAPNNQIVIWSKINSAISRNAFDILKYNREITFYNLGFDSNSQNKRYSRNQQASLYSSYKYSEFIDGVFRAIKYANKSRTEYNCTPTLFPDEPYIFIRIPQKSFLVGYELDADKLSNDWGKLLLLKSHLDSTFWFGLGCYPEESVITAASPKLQHLSLVPKPEAIAIARQQIFWVLMFVILSLSLWDVKMIFDLMRNRL